MRNFIMAALLVLFSINGIAPAAAEDDMFEIEAEGSYRMEANFPVDLAKKVTKESYQEEMEQHISAEVESSPVDFQLNFSVSAMSF